MRKTSIFLAIVFAVCGMIVSPNAQAQSKKESDNLPITKATVESLKNQIAQKDRTITELVNQNNTNITLRQKYDDCLSSNERLYKELEEAYAKNRLLRKKDDSLGKLYVSLETQIKENKTFITTTSEISDLVRDSMVINLVKNMELGLKFYQMSAEELASRYSGLSLNWQRAPDERYIFSRKAIEDISTRALQAEMLKWMRYLYDKSVSAERLRLSKLFLNITGDTYFERKY